MAGAENPLFRGSHVATWVDAMDTSLLPTALFIRNQLCDYPGIKVENHPWKNQNCILLLDGSIKTWSGWGTKLVFLKVHLLQ